MYWLRRIPAETRIVVLVVFLALFQAILLSVFGLGAIRGERRDVRDKLTSSAETFLHQYVAPRCQNELSKLAEQVFGAAFESADPRWRDSDPVPGDGLFTDAFRVGADGRILTPGGLPLLLPRKVVEQQAPDLRERARGIATAFRTRLVDEAKKPALDLEFARINPFLLTEEGNSWALLFAATPLVLGDGAPDAATLLRIRWVAILNRVAAYAPAEEVRALLGRVDAAGVGNVAYAEGKVGQDRRERLLRALERERARFGPVGQPRLHRNVMASQDLPFYVRAVGSKGDLRVLAVDRARLGRVLAGVVADAKRHGDGVELRIEEAEAAAVSGPRVPIEAMPGYTAAARIPESVVRKQARASERFYWYIIVFSVAGILAGGFLTARVVMREVKLAKLKSGFVSNVTHELKTPLTSIRMFAEMLRSGKVTDDAEREECLDVIAQETGRLSALIQQVLDFGRLDARKRRFHWVVGSIDAVVRKEVERFRRASGLGEDQFAVRIAEGLPPTTCDPEAFTEVITNLLSNAFKYTPDGKRRIALTLGAVDGRLVLQVEDNGPGISPRERRKIFEQFYRTGDLLTRDVEGTGLGLSIARNIVRAHGGRILVEDGELGGSRFRVVLPVARQAPVETTP